MRFEWNHDKDRVNQTKHKVSFHTACLVFDDPYHMSIQDRFDDNEERWQTLGMVGGNALLLVSHTVIEREDEDTTRIISARKATKKERHLYEQTHKKTKS